jgi:Peptidase family S41/Tricorn protease C1 domain
MPATLRWVALSLVLLLAMFAIVACEEDGDGIVSLEFADSSLFIREDEPDTTVVPDTLRLEIFDSLWQKIHDEYAYLEGKTAAWDAASAEYRDLVVTSLNNQEYRRLLLNMMNVMEDENLALSDTLNNVVQSYTPERDVNWRIGAWETTVDHLDYQSMGRWGWGLDDSVGYLYFKGFDPLELDIAQFDSVLGEMIDKRAILIDIRSAGETVVSLTTEKIAIAGNQILSESVLSRFVTEETSFLASKTQDSIELDTVTVSPNDELTYTGSVFLLMGEGTLNEAELFAMAMEQLPDVHLLGDPTTGVVGVTEFYPLTTGWNYAIPVIGFTTLAGDVLQGEGLPPDELIDWDPSSFNNRDQVLLDAFVLIDTIID